MATIGKVNMMLNSPIGFIGLGTMGAPIRAIEARTKRASTDAGVPSHDA
jgi:hypothetical protein